MTALVLAGTALLGGLGAVARVVLDDAVMVRLARTDFPAGILVVNLLGSFVLGVLVGAGLHGDALRLAGVGLLGGFTTFSTWMLDTGRLAGDGHRGRAAVNLLGSLAVGLLAVWLGRVLGGG